MVRRILFTIIGLHFSLAAAKSDCNNIDENAFFYEVSKNGVTSHILGSFHYGISANELHPKLLELHRQATSHYYETDINPRMIKEFKSFGSDPTKVLRSSYYLPPDHKERVSPQTADALVRIGVNRKVAQNLGKYHCVLSVPIFYSGKSIDYELFERSLKFRKDIFLLDYPGLRNKAFSMDEKESGFSLATCNISEDITSEQGVKEIQEMAGALKDYSNQKNNDYIKDGQDSATMWYRNQEWARMLSNSLTIPGKHFITVGGGHLHGPKGLITLLCKKGFEIKPLPHMAPAAREEEEFDDNPIEMVN